MIEYEVRTEALYAESYVVEADSPEEAKKAVLAGLDADFQEFLEINRVIDVIALDD